MSHDTGFAYGLWGLVLVNSAVFILFAFSFFHPRTKRDWRSLGAVSAFILALFVEMYGFPLTIYLMSGWIGRQFPQLDILSHDAGHLWSTLLGFKGDPHTFPIHILSYVFIFGGFWLLSSAWRVLFEAQKKHELATTGPYGYVRHPQYLGFIVIMAGFLLQWPTALTVVMFPVLVVMYVRLAHKEEREVKAELGATWDTYAAHTPRWIPRLRGRSEQPQAR